MLFATLVCVAWFGVCLNVLHFSGTTITHHYSNSIEHKSTKSPEIGLTRHESLGSTSRGRAIAIHLGTAMWRARPDTPDDGRDNHAEARPRTPPLGAQRKLA
jgi:hypothetical protein